MAALSVLDRILSLTDAKSSGIDKYRCRCPAHDDRNPSCQISVWRGKIYFKCFAGCEEDAIAAALTVSLEELRPNTGANKPYEPPVTLEELAAAKGLTVDDLCALGVYNVNGGVQIGYYLQDGRVADLKRIRYGLHAKDGSKWAKGDIPIPYGLNKLSMARQAGYVILFEGESDCWTLWKYGFPALGIPGASHTGKVTADHLAGIERIYIVQEPDKGGASFAGGMKVQLHALNFAGRIGLVPFKRGVKDPNDLHLADPEHFRERLQQLLEDAQPIYLDDDPIPAPASSSESSDTQAQALIRLAGKDTTFFRTPGGMFYARVPVRGHIETYPLDEKGGFRNWLNLMYYKHFHAPPSTTALGQAIDLCRAQAQYSDTVQPVFTRIGHQDGAIYLDMCDDKWRVIEITPTGWQILDKSPVAFARPRALLPLPDPQRNGSLDELRAFINIDDDDDWKLLVAWLIGTLHPTGPYPVLAIYGEHGAAKTSMTRFLRAIVDPAVAPTRTAPKDDRDLAIAAHNSWVIALENLSSMPGWLSDALCRLATGAGFATRSLYENTGETVFDAKRPIILNGIEEFATRGDLLSRTLIVTLPAIPENMRQAESILNKRFEEARPRIVGALLDAVSVALRLEPSVKLDALPRMADFARFIVACEKHLGWKAGSFLAAYDNNRQAAISTELEAPLPTALQVFMMPLNRWEGTPLELEVALKNHRPDADDHSRYSQWPRNARALSGQLKRYANALRAIGLAVDLVRTHGIRLIEIRKFDPIVGEVVPQQSQSDRVTQNFDRVTQNPDPVTQNISFASPGFSSNSEDLSERVTRVTQIYPLSSVAEKEKREGGVGNSGQIEVARNFASPNGFASPDQKTPSPEDPAISRICALAGEPHCETQGVERNKRGAWFCAYHAGVRRKAREARHVG